MKVYDDIKIHLEKDAEMINKKKERMPRRSWKDGLDVDSRMFYLANWKSV